MINNNDYAKESVTRKGYKHTALGWIPDEWNLCRLNELGDFSKGKGITKEQLSEKGLPCIRYGEIYTSHDIIIKEFKSFINKEVAQESKRIYKGNILFAGSGETSEEIGKAIAFIGDEEAYAGGDVIILSTNPEEVDTEYLSYILDSPSSKKQKSQLGQGNQVVHIYPSALDTMKVLVPPLPEQKAIAVLLSTWDKAIANCQLMIDNCQLRKKWLMQQLLTGKKRLPGFSEPWKPFCYDDLLTVVKRPVKWDDNELYKLISVRRRSGGVFVRESLMGNQILVKDLRTVNEGDFLFSKMQIVHGASALVTREFVGTKISGSYIAVVSKNTKLFNIEFLNWYSQLPYFYHQTYISSYGVHIEKMTFDFDTFLQMNISLPSTEEQSAIVRILQKANEEILLLKQKLEALKEQKKGLMKVLLTGKERIKL